MAYNLIQQVNQWDDRIFGKVFGDVHHKSWKKLFYGLSRSADSFSCALIGLAWMIAQPSSAPYVLAGALAFAVELSFYYLIKKSIKRPRPYRKLHVQCLIAPPDEFSFPSGHTAAAFLVASLIGLAFPVLSIPAFLWACSVGFSRVYLGVHYPTDVLAGMVLGLVSAQAGLLIVNAFLR